MTTFPGSPRLLKGGLVLVDANNGQPQRVINLQYNPETLSRTLQVQGIETGSSDRSQALRLKGPAVETINLEAEIDIADQLEFPDQNPNAVELGIYPQLAALETIVYPTSSQLQTNESLAQAGTLEIIPMLAPLTLFVWSKTRIVPVRLTDFSVTEEAFDPSLNPMRAKISLGMRVLSIDDIPFSSYGGGLFMTYLSQKEQLAQKSSGAIGAFGLGGLP
ncbi:hypothetical protein [Sphaerothrix gracilis]|uniref:hypothetical protein n=1 Tax=Sphaerothrix gracilis TaxID=3151835 RepID=UPI0031FCDA21